MLPRAVELHNDIFNNFCQEKFLRLCFQAVRGVGKYNTKIHRQLTGDLKGRGALARPRQRLVQICGFKYPKTVDVLLGLQVWPVGEEHLASVEFKGLTRGLPTRPPGPEPESKAY